MGVRYTVLGSGSRGNASLLQVEGAGLLIDAGLGPRQIGGRLEATGAAWNSVGAVLLTHVHADHWRESTLAQLLRREIPLYCHSRHAAPLRRRSEAFAGLEAAGLVRSFQTGRALPLFERIVVHPFPVPHDAGLTFGFRIERDADLFRRRWTMAYAADLGTWDASHVPLLAEVDLLSLEFNHDVAMQRSSGRPPHLIARVLGDEGHLSNEQAGELLGQVLRATPPGRLRDLVQLHLSRQCNHPRLASAAAGRVLSTAEAAARLHVASQDQPVVVAVVD